MEVIKKFKKLITLKQSRCEYQQHKNKKKHNDLSKQLIKSKYQGGNREVKNEKWNYQLMSVFKKTLTSLTMLGWNLSNIHCSLCFYKFIGTHFSFCVIKKSLLCNIGISTNASLLEAFLCLARTNHWKDHSIRCYNALHRHRHFNLSKMFILFTSIS